MSTYNIHSLQHTAIQIHGNMDKKTNYLKLLYILPQVDSCNYMYKCGNRSFEFTGKGKYE